MVAITLELVGPVPIVWGRFIWLAADRLTVLTLIASLVANDFWNLSGQAQFMALNSFFEHMGLIADLVMAALVAEHAKRRDG